MRLSQFVRFLLILPVYIILMTAAAAQIPQDIPHQTDPVDFTQSSNVWFYLGVPILMIILYIVVKKVRRNRQQP